MLPACSTGKLPVLLLMKPLSNIYHKICSIENLYQAAKATLARGRRYRGEGAFFSFHCEKEISRLRQELLAQTYKHGKYTLFKIYDPKERVVAAAPIRDRVVHHAVHDVIEPVFDRMFIYDSYACRKGKGTHQALKRANSFLSANRYTLHLDVKSYFPSIRHDILKFILQRYIADEKTLWLLNEIIDSSPDSLLIDDWKSPLPPFSKGGKDCKSSVVELQLSLFDQQPSSANRQSEVAVGLPIGNLTSQFFANLYLNELDQYAKHTLKCRYYIRYMDDMVLFDNDKVRLKILGNELSDFAAERLKLKFHEGVCPMPVSRGLTFLGFRLFPTRMRLKSENVNRFVKRMKGYQKDCAEGRMAPEELTQAVQSWVTHASYGQTRKLRRQLFSKFTFTFGSCRH
ncbi:RNA-dependent DNA polymerase [Candidatus Poribacteria bacterium]|nr:RNA-dependent DNA polymerase [Candidatus Poribacteria bacterium]